jgi:hypothetical protein
LAAQRFLERGAQRNLFAKLALGFGPRVDEEKVRMVGLEQSTRACHVIRDQGW